MNPKPNVAVIYEPVARPSFIVKDTTAVIIDAIRATTTIVTALASGCTEVVPCRTPEEVRAEAARRPAGSVVTAGERKGVRIEGLDLNNSPSVMTPERVGGRALLLTTTNGTQAIHDALGAREILIAALANRGAIARRAAALGRAVVLITAGTVGTVSCEDVLVAGAVIEVLDEEAVGPGFHLEDSARLALAAWRGAKDRLNEVFHQTWGGAFIAMLGLEADLAVCHQVDTTAVVPVVRGDPPRIVRL